MLTTKRVLWAFVFCALALQKTGAQSSPDFTGSVSGDPQVVAPGQTARYTITVIPLNGFTGDVSLSVSGLPLSYAFNPPVVTGGSGTAVLTVSTDPSRTAGQVTFQVTGTSGAISHSTYLTLEVAAAGNFSGMISPDTMVVTPGQTATYTVSLLPLGNFTGNVSLTVSGVPSGASASFSSSVLNTANPTSTLTVTLPDSFSDFATYVLLITGSSGSIEHFHSVSLEITPSGGGSPSSPQILKRLKLLNQSPGVSIPATTIFVAPKDGFYRISGYIFPIATDPTVSAGNLTASVSVNWTDESGFQGGGLTALSGSNSFSIARWDSIAGLSVSGTMLIFAKASTPVTISHANPFATTTSARYSLYLTVEGL